MEVEVGCLWKKTDRRRSRREEGGFKICYMIRLRAQGNGKRLIYTLVICEYEPKSTL